MLEPFVAAARLPPADPDQAASIGQAEGRATLALLRTLGEGDWTQPTDCSQWDVRSLVAHLIAQCEDSIHLATMLRRQLVGRRRYPAKTAVDAHMAVGVDDHHARSGPELVDASRCCGPGPCGSAGNDQAWCAAARSTAASPASPAGRSLTCSTSSSTATFGCTASTWPGNRAAVGPRRP
jgi:hypothetical protein